MYIRTHEVCAGHRDIPAADGGGNQLQYSGSQVPVSLLILGLRLSSARFKTRRYSHVHTTHRWREYVQDDISSAALIHGSSPITSFISSLRLLTTPNGTRPCNTLARTYTKATGSGERRGSDSSALTRIASMNSPILPPSDSSWC